MKILLVCAFVFLLASMVSAADTLDIYVVDTEGGKGMILRTPDGESMLVDGGYPTQDDRDTKRIAKVAQAAGIKQFDYIVATHYDLDHSGNVPRVDALVPGKVFVDHGDPIPTLSGRGRSTCYDPYVKAIGDRKRMSVKPGDTIPMKGLDITVVTAGGKALPKPLAGAGQPNPLTPASRPTYQDRDDNAGSVGLLYQFGKFRMLDLADLLSPVEYDLVCPKNLVGTVDLFMVSHHGFKVSNSKFLVHAVRPRVAVMNNSARKGGEPEVLEILGSSPGIEAVWQLHHAIAGGAKNAPADFIANPTEPCEAKLIKITAQRDGTFTVTNTRNGFSRTYKPR
ncbi:MAG: ComEC/Rec2 family competence protein [Pirellulales bacterium]